MPTHKPAETFVYVALQPAHVNNARQSASQTPPTLIPPSRGMGGRVSAWISPHRQGRYTVAGLRLPQKLGQGYDDVSYASNRLSRLGLVINFLLDPVRLIPMVPERHSFSLSHHLPRP